MTREKSSYFHHHVTVLESLNSVFVWCIVATDVIIGRVIATEVDSGDVVGRGVVSLNVHSRLEINPEAEVWKKTFSL